MDLRDGNKLPVRGRVNCEEINSWHLRCGDIVGISCFQDQNLDIGILSQTSSKNTASTTTW